MYSLHIDDCFLNFTAKILQNGENTKCMDKKITCSSH